MSITRALGAALAATFALGSVASLAAQTTYPSAKIKGRLQTQYYNFNHTTFADDSGSSNFFIRRARIQADVAINEYINMVIQPSFEGGRAPSSSSCTGHLNPDSTVTTQCTNGNGSIRLRDAYMDVSFMKESAKTRFTVRLGQEKRPFGRYELTSSNNLPSIERGAGKGLPGLASNDVFTNNGFLSHDVGASLILTSKLTDHNNVYLQTGVYNGEGESLNDKNKRKSFGVRGTVDVIKRLNVGGSFFSHDNAVVAAGKDSSYSNTAWGVDASWSKPGEAGLYAVVDYMQGEDRTKAANNIRGISVVGAYNIRLKSPTSWLYAVEPSFRYDLSDPNTAGASNKDEITTITGVVGFYMSSKAQFRVGYDYQKSQAPGTTAVSGVRTSLAVNF
jgi:Phosphate-selective porin O and P